MPNRLIEKSRFLKGETLLYIDVSYTMVHIPCFEKVNLQIRSQSGCFCETSFFKAGLYCTVLKPALVLVPKFVHRRD